MGEFHPISPTSIFLKIKGICPTTRLPTISTWKKDLPSILTFLLIAKVRTISDLVDLTFWGRLKAQPTFTK